MRSFYPPHCPVRSPSGRVFLQFEVILADILIFSVFQSESRWNHPGLFESKPFVQMPGRHVAFPVFSGNSGSISSL